MNKLKQIGGSILGAIASFSIIRLPSINHLSPLYKIFTVSVLGATLIILWGKNYF